MFGTMSNEMHERAMYWDGASQDVRAAESLLQHETVELFGAAGCGGVGEVVSG